MIKTNELRIGNKIRPSTSKPILRAYRRRTNNKRMKNKIVIDGKEYELTEVQKEINTFEDCVDNFKYAYNIDNNGNVYSIPYGNQAIANGSFAPSAIRAKQLQAISKMMTVADALNPTGWTHSDRTVRYGIIWNKGLRVMQPSTYISSLPTAIHFPTEELAKKAIKILGEDVIKTALGV